MPATPAPTNSAAAATGTPSRNAIQSRRGTSGLTARSWAWRQARVCVSSRASALRWSVSQASSPATSSTVTISTPAGGASASKPCRSSAIPTLPRLSGSKPARTRRSSRSSGRLVGPTSQRHGRPRVSNHPPTSAIRSSAFAGSRSIATAQLTDRKASPVEQAVTSSASTTSPPGREAYQRISSAKFASSAAAAATSSAATRASSAVMPPGDGGRPRRRRHPAPDRRGSSSSRRPA